MNVVVHLAHEIGAFRLAPPQLDELRARFPAHTWRSCATEAEFLAALPDAHATLVWHFDESWFARAPKLVFVATPAAGRERVGRDPSGRVRTLHGAFHGKIMGETLLGMLLYWSRGFDRALRDRRAHRYERDQFSATRRLAGQSLLLVGYGPLGRECALRAKALGMRVTGVKRSADVAPAPADAVFPPRELSRLLAEADHVVSLLPSDTGTRHTFDAQAFAAMKKRAYFYNLGRGNAVDEQALVAALENGDIAGAFLDVFEREPLPQDSPLWTVRNLEFLPHASAIAREYLELWLDELTPELEALGSAGTTR